MDTWPHGNMYTWTHVHMGTWIHYLTNYLSHTLAPKGVPIGDGLEAYGLTDAKGGMITF